MYGRKSSKHMVEHRQTTWSTMVKQKDQTSPTNIVKHSQTHVQQSSKHMVNNRQTTWSTIIKHMVEHRQTSWSTIIKQHDQQSSNVIH
jgi:hypothetical protein